MGALANYQAETLELLHDPNNIYFPVADITGYINRGRQRIAAKSQSVRLLLSGGTITGISIVSGGSGYSGTATVTISGAGQQASATATISGGAVNSITLVTGGWGYITGTTTTVTVTGSGGGSNATFNVTIDNSLTTVPGQEVYTFASANPLAQIVLPGSNLVQGIFSVAIAWGANAAMKPMMNEMIWSEFQAYYRSYNTGMQSYPTIWSKYAQGILGSIYVWPLPSQASQMDWDAWIIPANLVDDTSPECMSYPWNTPVSYYAAYLAFFNAQRFDDAERMKKEYEGKLLECIGMTQNPFVQNYYEGDF